MELAGFDAWEEGWRELGREARQSSRRQSYRRDIVPPIAIYIRPLSIQPYASATHTFRSSPPDLALLSLSLSLCGPNPSCRLPTHPFHFNHPSTRPLSLRRFPSTRTQPLFSPPLSATIALLPPFRNALGLRVGVERERKGVVDARVATAGGRLSALLLLRRSMYMVLLQEGRFFASLFFLLFFSFEGWHSSGTRIRNLPADNSRRLDRRPRLRPLTSIRAAIDVSNSLKLLYPSTRLLTAPLLRINKKSYVTLV